MTTFDFLSQLAPPEVIEEVAYQDILDALNDDYQASEPSWTADETDPIFKANENYAYREFLLRQWFNARVRQLLLQYATGDDLRSIGASRGVFIRDGETEAEFKRRIQRPGTEAPVGSVARVKALAFEADDDVKDVSTIVASNNQDLDVYILSNEDRSSEMTPPTPGTPTAALISTVQDYISDVDEGRVQIGTTYTVAAPTITTYTVTMEVNFLSDVITEAEAISRAEDALEAFTTANYRLGRAIYREGLRSAVTDTVAGIEFTSLTSPSSNQIPSDDSTAHYASSITVTASEIT